MTRKTYKLLVRLGKGEDEQTIAIEQGDGTRGKVKRIKAAPGAQYQLIEDQERAAAAPHYVKVRRVGDHLEVLFENETQASLVLEDYYRVMPEGHKALVGQAENGAFYEYIPEDPDAQGLIPMLKADAQAVSVALGGSEITVDALAAFAFTGQGAALGVLAFNPLFAAAGLAGTAAALAVTGDGGADTTLPTVTISSDATEISADQTATLTFTLSEPVSDFTVEDISVTGGSLSNFQQSSSNPLVYTVTFTPAADLASALVRVDSGRFSDAAGNVNQDGADADNIVTFSILQDTRPDPYNPANSGQKTAISLDPLTGDNVLGSSESAPVNITGKVSGVFAAGDVVTFSVNGKTYSAAVTSAGAFSVAVPAAELLADRDSKIEAEVTGTGGDKATAAQDYIVQGNPAAPTQTTLWLDPLTGDNVLAAGEKTGSHNLTGRVGGKFAAGDVVSLQIHNKTFSGPVAANGSFSIAVPAADLAADADSALSASVTGSGGSAATALLNYAVESGTPTDTTAPTISISSSKTSVAGNETAVLTFTLSEASNDFTASDISVTGGQISNFVRSSNALVYTATFTPKAGATSALVWVDSERFSDAAGNFNRDGSEANNSMSLAIHAPATDTQRPSVVVSSPVDEVRAGSGVTVYFTVSETGTDFGRDAVGAVNGTLGPLTQSTDNPRLFSATFTPRDDVTSATVFVSDSKFRDASGNLNHDPGDENDIVSWKVTPKTSTPPVVIDLDGDGDIAYGHTLLDINGDGQLDLSAWAAPGDGVLVHDANGDGRVSGPGEFVFARHAGETDLQGLAARFDTDANGRLDAGDAAFAALGVWRDANGNGISDAGEWRSLGDLGMRALQLHSDGIDRQPAPGVHEAGRTVVEMGDGSTRVAADVSFDCIAALLAQTAPAVHALQVSEVTLELGQLGAAAVEVLDLHGNGPQTLGLHFSQWLAQPAGQPLKVLGAPDDAVRLLGPSVMAVAVQQEGQTWQGYDLDRNGSLDLLVQQQLMVSFQG